MRSCPRCTGPLLRLLANPTSLRDGTTPVCRACRVVEVRRASQGLDPWPAYPRAVK